MACEWGEEGGKEIKRGNTEVMEVLVVKLAGMGSFRLFMLVSDVA